MKIQWIDFRKAEQYRAEGWTVEPLSCHHAPYWLMATKGAPITRIPIEGKVS